jgi:hypothetical protein
MALNTMVACGKFFGPNSFEIQQPVPAQAAQTPCHTTTGSQEVVDGSADAP